MSRMLLPTSERELFEQLQAQAENRFEGIALKSARAAQKHPMESVERFHQRMEMKKVGRGCLMCGQIRRYSIVRCACSSCLHVAVDLTKYTGPMLDVMPVTREGLRIDPVTGLVDRTTKPDQPTTLVIRPVPSMPIAGVKQGNELIQGDWSQYPNVPQHIRDASDWIPVTSAPVTPSMEVKGPTAEEKLRDQTARQQEEIERLKADLALRSQSPAPADAPPAATQVQITPGGPVKIEPPLRETIPNGFKELETTKAPEAPPSSPENDVTPSEQADTKPAQPSRRQK